MPRSDEKRIVLVTGITGFIGVHVALKILEHGFSVRGTVQFVENGELLQKQSLFRPYSDKLSLV